MATSNNFLQGGTYPTGSPIPETLNNPQFPSLSDILAGIMGGGGGNATNPDGTPVVGPDGKPVSKSMDPKVQALLGLLGLGGQFGAAAIQQGNTGAAANYIKDVGGTARDRSTANFDQSNNTWNTQNGGLQSILSNQNPWSQIISQGFMGNVGTLNNLLPGLIQSGQNLSEFGSLPNNLLYQDPNMVAQTRGITDLTSNTSGMLSKAAQLLNSGGVTDTQSPLNNFALQLMQGKTPNQLALSGAGTDILGTGGMTPALQNAMDQASGVVSSQGRTDLTDKLAAMGIDLAGRNPLLSGAEAASMAEDQAGRQYGNATRNAHEQAALRGQGAGSVVANGAGNQAMADASDTALAGISKAANDARLGQQGLGLQQQQQGLSTALGAGGLQQGLELGGLNSVGNLTGASTGRLGVGGALTNDASQLANSGGNFYNALLGLQQGNMAQGFQAGNQNVQSQAGLLQQAMQDIMQGRTGAASIGSDLAKQYGTNTDRILSGGQTGMQDILAALAQYGAQGSNQANNASTNLSTYGNTANSFSQLMQQPNSYATVLNNFAGSLAQPAGSTAGSKVANGAGTAIGTAIGTLINGQINGNRNSGNLFGGGGIDLSPFLPGGTNTGYDPFSGPFGTNYGAAGSYGFDMSNPHNGYFPTGGFSGDGFYGAGTGSGNIWMPDFEFYNNVSS